MRRKIPFIALFLLFGGAVDFLANGLLKIGFAVVYVPLYIAIASSFPSWLPGRELKALLHSLTAAFLVGALLFHLALAARSVTLDYPMNVTSPASPVTLVSQDSSQTLLLSGVKSPLTGQVSVLLRLLTDYGCTQSFKILSVAGMDVDRDRSISWVWKTRPGALSPKQMGPGLRGPSLFWCR